ncbi:hypothetical protein GU3_08755 [Oceanimonas sp. GK1]|uniref:hypothetical protein n=1 Tax=Oceanimonas sp. (strain GK1 / IBRC-M 10197) TaxID=511062 RepID=UPI0002495433|nr:hypothetical protein [Oceanimonas sp. GK1]AEY01507.1 hypothetical protein GU3_08755 [Oceanimonas sp. GK1]
MESLIKYAENVFQIPQVSIFSMLLFLFSIKVAKKYFDSKIEEVSSKKRFVVEELKTLDKSNAYLVEQVFSERYGYLMNYKEIVYFLRTSRPSLNIHLYQSAAPYFVFNKTDSQLKLHSKNTVRALRLKGFFFMIGYYAFSMLGLSLLNIIHELKSGNDSSFLTSLFLIVSLLFFSAMCATAQIKTEQARKLLISIEFDKS